jgi:hypothetical protein
MYVAWYGFTSRKRNILVRRGWRLEWVGGWSTLLIGAEAILDLFISC